MFCSTAEVICPKYFTTVVGRRAQHGIISGCLYVIEIQTENMKTDSLQWRGIQGGTDARAEMRSQVEV